MTGLTCPKLMLSGSAVSLLCLRVLGEGVLRYATIIRGES